MRPETFRPKRLVAAGLALVAALAAGPGAPATGPATGPATSPATGLETGAANGSADGPRPLHADPAEAEEALVRAVRAFLRDDLDGVASALDALARTTRVARPEEADDYGSIVGYSRSFELTTNLAREYLAAGRPDDAYEQFVWLQKACRACHVEARGRNLLSSSSPADSGSPSRSSGATPSR